MKSQPADIKIFETLRNSVWVAVRVVAVQVGIRQVLASRAKVQVRIALEWGIEKKCTF